MRGGDDDVLGAGVFEHLDGAGDSAAGVDHVIDQHAGPALNLPDDRPLGGPESFDGRDGADERPEALHYVPLNHPGVRARMAGIAAWAERTDPALIVVDVSVEIAILARLLSIPTVVVPPEPVIRAFDRIVTPMFEEIEANDEEAQTLAALRDSLLPKLLSGQIRTTRDG